MHEGSQQGTAGRKRHARPRRQRRCCAGSQHSTSVRAPPSSSGLGRAACCRCGRSSAPRARSTSPPLHGRRLTATCLRCGCIRAPRGGGAVRTAHPCVRLRRGTQHAVAVHGNPVAPCNPPSPGRAGAATRAPAARSATARSTSTARRAASWRSTASRTRRRPRMLSCCPQVGAARCVCARVACLPAVELCQASATAREALGLHKCVGVGLAPGRTVALAAAAPAGVMSVHFHPSNANLLAAGCYDGSVAVFDTRRRGGTPLYQATVKSGKHSDAVWQVGPAVHVHTPEYGRRGWPGAACLLSGYLRVQSGGVSAGGAPPAQGGPHHGASNRQC